MSFTELNPELAPECGMGGDGSGNGMMTPHSMVTPMVSNEAVTITIIDNDGMGELAYVCLLLSFLKE